MPLIIRWPGVTAPGHVCEEPVISTDFYPTMLEMADLPLKPQQHLDGQSLAPLLRKEKDVLARDALYFHFPQDHHINSMGPSGSVRVGNFKLVEAYGNGKVELYNLRRDIGEKNDLSETIPAKTRELKRLLHDWHIKVGVKLSLKSQKHSP